MLLVFGLAQAQAQQDAPDRSVAQVEIQLAPDAGTRLGPQADPVQAAAPRPAVPASTRALQPLNRTAAEVGHATEQLLAMQRASEGQRPRPIDGEHASRSLQRYLKSFETEIPEHYETGIDTGASSR